jgi:hypothetical protein
MTAARFQQRPSALTRTVPGGLLLLDAAAHDPFRERATPELLSASGPIVWELLGEARTLEEIASLVKGRFGVTTDAPDEGEVQDAIARLLADLNERKLVEPA